MILIATRHGETEWNVLKKVQGKANISLNNHGIEQANIIKDKLLNKSIDIIFCSPLKRAKETAEIINKTLNIPIIYDERISERDFGEFEGKAIDNFDFVGFWSYKNNYKYEKAENIRNFFDRVYDFLDEINLKYKDKTILVVSHGGVSIPINCYYNGILENDNLRALILNNCELIELIK